MPRLPVPGWSGRHGSQGKGFQDVWRKSALAAGVFTHDPYHTPFSRSAIRGGVSSPALWSASSGVRRLFDGFPSFSWDLVHFPSSFGSVFFESGCMPHTEAPSSGSILHISDMKTMIVYITIFERNILNRIPIMGNRPKTTENRHNLRETVSRLAFSRRVNTVRFIQQSGVVVTTPSGIDIPL